ncbi:MAG TPA: hypothetical protein VFY29_02255 [Terriglobia bacterium]|nr:hypothetical protein [Terriglobia bacterium]
MKRRFVKQFTVALFAFVAVMMFSSVGYAQNGKIDLGEGRWVSVGAGIRSSFRATKVGSGSGSFYDKGFNIDNIRLYINSEVHKDFQVEFNTDYDGSGDIQLLDAVVKYQPSESFSIWFGRHITPSDRANLDGPYYLGIFDYPGLVSMYPAKFAGRDNGISVSGHLCMRRLKYAFGIYDGAANVAGQDSNLYAGRVTVNLIGDEPDAGGKSGYYTGSGYYGEKDQILALGFVSQFQNDVVAQIGGSARSFFGYNADLLWERKLSSGGVVDVEGAWYKYNVGRSVAFTGGVPSVNGSAFLMQASYLFPQEVAGVGKFQPVARYQDFRDSSILDVGTNFVIRGHSAILSFAYSPSYTGGAWNNRVDSYTGGAQFQF